MTILLVEDNRDLASQISASLTGEIRLASSLDSAKQFLAREPIHLVLLDLGLPDSQGLDTLRAVQMYGIPIVVLTANVDLAQEAVHLGVTDYVIKRDPRDMANRIRFNVNKLCQPRKKRFSAEAFEVIKSHICLPSVGGRLTLIG